MFIKQPFLAACRWWARQRSRPGALIVEAMMAITLFGMFAAAAIIPTITGQESSQTGANRVRAVYYAEQGLEVVRAIRDIDYSELVAGTYGYDIDSAGDWALTGTNLNYYGYQTNVNIEDVSGEPNRKIVHARVAWKMGYFRSGAILLSTEVTNWRDNTQYTQDWTNITGYSYTLPAGAGLSTRFTDMALTNSGQYLFVANENRDTSGDGIYVFDTTTDPVTRVATNFDLPGSTIAKDLAIFRNELYVLTNDGSNEIYVYDISNPSDLDATTTYMYQYDISGNGLANAMYRKGGALYVGLTCSGSCPEEFRVLDISASGSVALLDSLELGGSVTVNDVYVRGDFAYISGKIDSSDLVIIDVSDPEDISIQDNANYFSAQGNAVTKRGSGYLVGSSGDQEYILVEGSGGYISSNTRLFTPSNGVLGIDADPLGCYAMLSVGSDTVEARFEVYPGRDLNASDAEYTSIGLTQRKPGRVLYDVINDRAFITTGSGVHTIIPTVIPDEDNPCK